MRCLVLHITVATAAGLVAFAALADGSESGLRHNPFDKPAILAVPVKKPEPAVVQRQEPPPLKGTLVSADTPMAIVDDTLLRVGEEHAGFRLVSVEEGAAVFEHDGEEVKVLMADSDAKARTR